MRLSDVAAAFFLLRLHALAKKFAAGGVQNNAFNFCAAEVYADAKHLLNLRPRRRPIQARNGSQPLFLTSLVSHAPIFEDANTKFSQTTA